MLTVLTVDSLGDDIAVDGKVTLREAIQAANTDAQVGDAVAGNGADLIQFHASLNGQTITLDGTELEVTSEIQFDGPGADLLTIDANGLSRVFHVGDSALAIISGLTLTGGSALLDAGPGENAGNGGALLNTGELALEEVAILGNTADGMGGGIFNDGGRMSITDSILRGNTAGGSGGAVAVDDGDVAVLSSVVTGNTSGRFGGGIRSGGDGELYVGNSVIADNSAAFLGGGIALNPTASTTQMAVVNSTIIENTATRGGGLSIDANLDNDVIVANTVIAQNQAHAETDLSLIGGELSATGGSNLIGIWTGDGSPDASSIFGTPDAPLDPMLTVLLDADGNIRHARPMLDSPVIDTGNNALALDFEENPLSQDLLGQTRIVNYTPAGSATVDIGAVELQTGIPQLSVSHTPWLDIAEGGNATVEVALTAPPAATVTVNINRKTGGSSDVTANKSTLTFNASNWDQPQTITFSVAGDSDRQNEQATFEMVVPGLETVYVAVTGVDDDARTYIVNSLADVVAADGVITLREALEAANTNTAVHDAPAGSEGAADRITFAPSLFSGGPRNIMLTAGMLEIHDDVKIDGPGADQLTIDADQQTRAFWIGPDVVASLSDFTITGGLTVENDFNGASDGGGIYNAGDLTLDSFVVNGNRSPNSNGGGISNWGSLTIVDSVITGNSADRFGGGIRNEHGNVDVRDSIISGNTTTGGFGNGGGIDNAASGTMTITNSVIVGNEVKGAFAEGGGGIFNDRGQVTITNSTIAGNAVPGDFTSGGGGVHNSAGTLVLNNTIIARNTAASFGPDIYSPFGTETGAYNLIGQNTDQTDLEDGVDGNIVGTAAAPVDPVFERNPSNGGDGWGDDPSTTGIDESANDDLGNLRLHASSPAVDSGDNALAVDANGDALSTDILGNARIHNGTVDRGAYERGAAPVAGTAEIAARLVTAATTFDSPATGEVVALPGNVEWIDEWTPFYVEIWVSTPDSTDKGVVSAQLDLTYNTDYYTPVDIEYGPAFDTLQVGTIDDPSGIIDGLGAGSFATDAGDDGYTLLARVRFDFTVDDAGVALNADGQYITPVGTGIGVSDTEVMLTGPTQANVEIATLPDTELWPVMYDIDDSNSIGFGDFAFFATAFQQTVGEPGAEFAWASDFDHDGRVDFGDFAFFAQNFQRTRDSGIPLDYHTSFPDQWRPDPLTLASATAGLPSNAAGETLNSTALEPIVTEAKRRIEQSVGTDAAAVLDGVTVGIADLPGDHLGYSTGSQVWIDLDAAGRGWFVDATPRDDSEFTFATNSDDLLATLDGPAADRADLLTAVMHELGHALGLGHADHADDLMAATLPLGVRRSVDAHDSATPVDSQLAAPIHDELFTLLGQ